MKRFTNWLRTLGAPEDPVATDTSSEWSAMSLLKAIFQKIEEGGIGGGDGTPGGSTGQVQYKDGGNFGGISGATTNGTVLTLTAPVFVTPTLGTPASGVATNLTGLPLSSGVTGTLPLANGGLGAALADPNADRIFFWDDSAGASAFLTLGTGLTITGTTLDATGGGSGDVPSTLTLTAGAGLTGGGDLSTNRSFAVGAGTGITVNADDVAIANTTVAPGAYTYGSFTVDQQGRLTAASSGTAPYVPAGTDVALADGGTGASLTDPNADRLMFWDDSAGSMAWLTAGSGLSIAGTTITATASGAADVPILCTNVFTGGAGYNLYELTAVSLPGGTPSALVHGMQFRFTPAGTIEGGGAQIDCTDFSDGPKYLMGVDGHTPSYYYDLQKEKPVTVEYRTGLTGWESTAFIIVDETASFSQNSFPHATGKLQTSGATTISLTQEDGRGLVLWNPQTSSFRHVPFAVVTNNSLFTAVNYVDGVANQALASNQNYAVYLCDPGGHPAFARLEFWRLNIGATEGWTPATNSLGFYVKCGTVGGAGVDNTRTFLGLLHTGTSTVATSLNGTAIIIPCASHLKPWRFPFESDRVTYSSFATTSFTTQSTPRCELITSGITDTGYFTLTAQILATAALRASIQLVIDGTDFAGTAFSATSDEQSVTLAAGAYGCVTTSWGAAIPMGNFRIRPAIKVSASNATFDLNLTGIIAN